MPSTNDKKTAQAVSDGFIRLADFVKIKRHQHSKKSVRAIAIHRYRHQRDLIPVVQGESTALDQDTELMDENDPAPESKTDVKK